MVGFENQPRHSYLRSSGFNITSYIAFFFTSRLYIDKRYGQFFFHKNIYVDRKTEKLISQPQKETLSSCICIFYVYKIQKVYTNIKEK